MAIEDTAVTSGSDSPPSFEKTGDAPSLTEKGHAGGRTHSVGDGHVPVNLREEDFLTRNGLNLRSFQRRDWGIEGSQLDRSMKSRHVNMIAIGGSIGAGQVFTISRDVQATWQRLCCLKRKYTALQSSSIILLPHVLYLCRIII